MLFAPLEKWITEIVRAYGHDPREEYGASFAFELRQTFYEEGVSELENDEKYRAHRGGQRGYDFVARLLGRLFG